MTARKFPAFPSIDLSNFDLSKIELPKIELPKFEKPTFEMPKFEMPKFGMPRVDVPKVEIPKFDSAAVTNVAKDAVYIAIGLTVLTIQKLQVQRRELTKSVRTQTRRVTPA